MRNFCWFLYRAIYKAPSWMVSYNVPNSIPSPIDLRDRPYMGLLISDAKQD